MPPHSADGPHAIDALIECPAGTVVKRAWDPRTGKVRVKRAHGRAVRYHHLPFPANFGCFPGTRVTDASGGDGDPLDVFVLCEALPAGTRLAVEPIGLLRISDEHAINDRVIALPRDRHLRVLDVHHVRDLPSGVVDILRRWLLHHDPDKPVRIKRLKGPKAAWRSVERWRVPARKAGH